MHNWNFIIYSGNIIWFKVSCSCSRDNLAVIPLLYCSMKDFKSQRTCNVINVLELYTVAIPKGNVYVVNSSVRTTSKILSGYLKYFRNGLCIIH